MKYTAAGKTTVILLLLFLTGCATHRDAWNQVYGVPVNSTVHLLQPLTIGIRRNQVFLQDGNIAEPRSFYVVSKYYDQYYPFCYFEVPYSSSSPQTIEPDSFTVTAVYQDETDVVTAPSSRLMSIPSIGGEEGGARSVALLTVMRLHSDKQPHVKQLVCTGGFELESWAKPATLKEIDHALGEIARLDTAAGSP